MKRTAASRKQKGFTFIELLIVLTIIAFLMGVVIISIGGSIDTAREKAYITTKHQVQTATIAFSAKNLGRQPLTGNTTLVDDKTLYVIDICALNIHNSSAGLLQEIPQGSVSNPDNDNCDSTEYNCSCYEDAHYLWSMDAYGIVYTSCIDTETNGGGCDNTEQDGFQGVWP